MLDPYSSIKTIIRVTNKKRHQLTLRFGTFVLEPYCSIQAIIWKTTKKRHQLTPRFWICVLDPYRSIQMKLIMFSVQYARFLVI